MKRKNKTFPNGILLDVGCRDRKQPNFVGIDREQRPGVDIVHDLEKFPYPIDAWSCITIKCAHVIEHIKPWLVIDFMNEMWRMLLPEGQLAISAPYAGSPGFYQDPTHCTNITERTWNYFNIDSPLWEHYKPKPWKVEHIAYKPDGNIEVVMRKAQITDGLMNLTVEALRLGAIQKPTELSALLTFLQTKDLETVVEIGTARGGVFYTLCQLAKPDALLVSIDMPGGDFGGGYTKEDEKKFLTFAKGKQDLRFIRKNSHDSSTKRDLLRILNGRKVDLLFIDGDHTYSGVKKDWTMYSPLVKKGGFVVFHDICHHPTIPTCKVDKLWNELKKAYSTTEFIDPNDQNWGGIGVLVAGSKA
jgi:predicted O-methyltransferase YrrM